MSKTVVTVLDNGKLLEPQVLENDKLSPFYKINKTNEKGERQLDKEGNTVFIAEAATDWTKFGFSSEEEYKEAIKRKPVLTKSK